MKIIKVGKSNSQKAIKEAVKALQSAGIVIYPTETCYGVGVDATSKKAVEKLLLYKERPEGKAISIAVADKEMAEKYVEINQTARNLYDNFLPGPITVISKSKGKTAKDLEAENRTLGVRIPDYSLIIQIIKMLGKPISATSANASGKKTPYKISDILNNISIKKKKLITLILDAGELSHNPPSTVVETMFNDLNILRKGRLDFSSFSKKKKVETFISLSENETQKRAEKLMNKLKNELQNKCLIFALQGNLGAGKTQFAKGVARALNIKENILSPTFVLVREYDFSATGPARRFSPKKTHKGSLFGGPPGVCHPSPDKFFHLDTWRMREGKELLELGFEEMIKPGNVIVIEWLEKVREILDNVASYQDVILVWVGLDYQDEKTREITIFANSK